MNDNRTTLLGLKADESSWFSPVLGTLSLAVLGVGAEEAGDVEDVLERTKKEEGRRASPTSAHWPVSAHEWAERWSLEMRTTYCKGLRLEAGKSLDV